MKQGVTQSQRMEAGVGLRVDPRLVVTSQILLMNNAELEQALDTELAENPALERLDTPDGPNDDEILWSVAPQEFAASGDSWEPQRSLSSEAEPTWTDLLPSASSLAEHLEADLQSRLPAHLHHLGSYLIGSLDERGYLTNPTEEIALDFGCSIEDAELAISQLQRCNPPGIGARDVKECLMLQLRGADSIELKLARSIVRNHLDDFAARRVLRMSRRFRVLPALVESAFEIIAGLTPFPAEGFHNAPCKPDREPTVSPDIVFLRNEQGWEVQVTGLDPNSVTLNRFYTSRLEKLRDNPILGDRDERRHLAAYIQRARSFISSLEMRRDTLTRVGKYLVAHQGAFLSTADYAFLQPLTRAKLADEIGVHESTISRATNGKFVQLPNGELASFDVFFKASLRVQKMIAEILHTENPGNPLSDERISAMLSERGIHIARRTVSKYRDRTKSLSSRKRRAA